MRNRLQFNIIFTVLLFTSCFGGPVHPPKKNTTSSSNDLPEQAINLPADTPKLEEESLKPVSLEANKASNNSVLNINVKLQPSTEVKLHPTTAAAAAAAAAASNQVGSQAASVKNNASAVPAVPTSRIPPVGATNAAAEGQSKTDINQSEVVVAETKSDNISDGKITEKNEPKVTESVITNEAKENNLATKDEIKPDEIAEEVNQKKNTNDSVLSPTLPTVNVIKSTVSEDKKSNDSEPETKSNETEPKPEPSLEFQNNGSTPTQKESIQSDNNTQNEKESAQSVNNTQNEKESTQSDNNTHNENQVPSIGSDSNTQDGNELQITNSQSNPLPDTLENKDDSDLITQPDNKKPSLNPESDTHTEDKDFSIESDNIIQGTKNDPSENESPVQASKAATPSSSFDIKYGDASATYQQISDADYSSFDNYDNKNGMSSSNDIIEEGLNNEDMSYSNDLGSYEKERGAYENQKQKLNGDFTSDEDSHFFAYFLTIMVTAIVFYLLFHNKQRVGQACGCVNKNDRLKRIKEDRAKEPLLKSDTTDG